MFLEMYLIIPPIVCIISLLMARVKCADDIIRTLHTGNLNDVRRAMAKCENVNLLQFGVGEYSTPLIEVVQAGRLELVEHLLYVLKVDIDGTDSAGYTALMRAIKKENMVVSRFLLVKGANACAQSREGDTALHLATETGTDMTKMMVDHCIANGYGTTALNVKNNLHETPLMKALKMPPTHPIYDEHIGVVGTLIDAGVDINCDDNEGTALQVAGLTGKYEAVEMLLKAGVKVNKKLKNSTALDAVLGNVRVQMNSYYNPSIRKVVDLLLEYGARVHPRYRDVLLKFSQQNIGRESPWTKYLFLKVTECFEERGREPPIATVLKFYVMGGLGISSYRDNEENKYKFPEKVRYCYDVGAYPFYIAFKRCGRSNADFDGEVAAYEEVAYSILFRGSSLERLLGRDEEMVRKAKRLAAAVAAARTLTPDANHEEWLAQMPKFPEIYRL